MGQSGLAVAVNRRSSPRRKPKASTRLTCATGKLGMGANRALSILDVSETGIRMVLKTPPKVGEEMQINLESIVDKRAHALAATVIWCATLADGNHAVGARFQKPLPYAVLQSLAYL
jgi:hypothetical protein